MFTYYKYCLKETFENNNWFNHNIDLYFINMDISKDRRENMEKQLNKHNIKFNRFPAYNGSEIKTNFENDLINNYNVFNKNSGIYNTKKGSFGNFLSQTSCWYNFYKNSSKKYIMVLEDDIELLPNFNTNKVQEIINSLNSTNWDMLKLFYFGRKSGTDENKMVYKANNNGHNVDNTGMQIYIIPKKSIPKLLDFMLPIKNTTFDMKNKQAMGELDIYISNEKFVKTFKNNSLRKMIDKSNNKNY